MSSAGKAAMRGGVGVGIRLGVGIRVGGGVGVGVGMGVCVGANEYVGALVAYRVGCVVTAVSPLIQPVKTPPMQKTISNIIILFSIIPAHLIYTLPH